MKKQGKRISATGDLKVGNLSKKRLIRQYQDIEPQMTVQASASSTSGVRSNIAAVTTRANRFTNIEEGLTPFKYASSGYGKGSNWDVREPVILCQKAYYNVAVFRNTIDLMTEFTTSEIYFKGGSKKSREFFRSLCRKWGILDFEDKFYREYYRSGNVFILRQEGEVQTEDIKKINQTFASEKLEKPDKLDKAKTLNLPVRYVILNPADIQANGTVSFSNNTYYKVLSDYELERLRAPKTEEDQEIFDNLPEDIKKKIKQKTPTIVLLPLDPERISAVFYKKQDYEPFSVPMGYPVLEDINWKLELKKMDMQATRTMQQIILLVTMGAEPEKGGVSQKHLDAVKAFFENNSIGRVLVADYTTKASFVIPDIAALLDPKKYEMVNRDILQGLNNVFLGANTAGDGEKFANQSIKVKIFIERLRQARQVFLNEFLVPEIKRIAKDIGLKNFPQPHFAEIDFKDELEYAKLYTQWLQFGALTPDELFQAVDNGQLPSEEESLEHQNKFKALKDKGLYEPILGGPATQKELADKTISSQEKTTDKQIQSQEKMGEKQMIQNEKSLNTKNEVQLQINKNKLSAQKGRPTGSKAPKKKATPVGASIEEELFSLSKIKENMILSNELHNTVASEMLKKFKLKKLSEQQKEVAGSIAELIIINEEPSNWLTKISEYIEEPIGKNADRASEIEVIAAKHGVNHFLAGLLYASIK